LTPYIESGQIEDGQAEAKVTLNLDGLTDGEQPESYSGFITVDAALDSNMFFWFFPATVCIT
jgi:vitellogenic carboxypeptidase-like protein